MIQISKSKVISTKPKEETIINIGSTTGYLEEAIVFLHREDGSVNFAGNWTKYKTGFGNPEGEFWLGLDQLHNITSQGNYRLVVDFTDFEGMAYQSRYEGFSVGDESSKYRLTIYGYDSSSSGGDSLITDSWYKTLHNMMFSTQDCDNDRYLLNCALHSGGGGWWFNNCGQTNPTGEYLIREYANNNQIRGITWEAAKGNLYSFKTMTYSLIPKAT